MWVQNHVRAHVVRMTGSLDDLLITKETQAAKSFILAVLLRCMALLT